MGWKEIAFLHSSWTIKGDHTLLAAGVPPHCLYYLPGPRTRWAEGDEVMGERRRDLRKEKQRLNERRVQDPVRDQRGVHQPVHDSALHPSPEGVFCLGKFLFSPFLSLSFVSLGVQLLFSLCEEHGHLGGQPVPLTLRLYHCSPGWP